MKQLMIGALVSLMLTGCGGGASTTTTPPAAAAGTTYHSVLKHADITTSLKHIIFFNTTTVNYNGASTPKGSILGQAFVNDAILAVPIPPDNFDVIIADPVDPSLCSLVAQSGGYVVKTTATGATTGPYASAITRADNHTQVYFLIFDMLTGSVGTISAPASMMFMNIHDDGAILPPAGGVYSYGWKVNPLTGELVPL